jgi:hypothetical protein
MWRFINFVKKIMDEPGQSAGIPSWVSIEGATS